LPLVSQIFSIYQFISIVLLVIQLSHRHLATQTPPPAANPPKAQTTPPPAANPPKAQAPPTPPPAQPQKVYLSHKENLKNKFFFYFFRQNLVH
jgi:hypothetical protein